MRRAVFLIFGLLSLVTSMQAQISAGVARVDITDRTVPVSDPCYAKALVIRQGPTSVALITLDAVAIGGIGRIGDRFLTSLRAELQRDLGISPDHVLVNASHCHGIIRADVQQLIRQAVQEAAAHLTPVTVFSGVGRETRISENRRMQLKDGTQADMRRAYAMPPDEEVVSVGPIDPQVGLLRLDRTAEGSPLAVVYHFACHPIMNPPSKGNSADFPGFASKVIEEATGAMAFFLQGCGGDINPVHYKEVSRPADAEPLGTLLGASVLAALRPLKPQPNPALLMRQESLSLPRAADYRKRITQIEEEQKQLVTALRPTNVNFKAFLPLLLQQKLWPEKPSHAAQAYLHQAEPLQQLDADNKALIETYLGNVAIMEKLTRLNTNLALLKKHLAETEKAETSTIDAEVCALRIGDFKLITFPGEVTVEVGLQLKQIAKDPQLHISGYTNGYLFYTATEAQRLNSGYAQEDCDVRVAPEWRKLFEAKAMQLFQQISQP